jgi:hypothetical protein
MKYLILILAIFAAMPAPAATNSGKARPKTVTVPAPFAAFGAACTPQENDRYHQEWQASIKAHSCDKSLPLNTNIAEEKRCSRLFAKETKIFCLKCYRGIATKDFDAEGVPEMCRGWLDKSYPKRGL